MRFSRGAGALRRRASPAHRDLYTVAVSPAALAATARSCRRGGWKPARRDFGTTAREARVQMNRSLLAPLLLPALVAACGTGEPPAEPEAGDASGAASPEPADANVFTPLTDTIDRAESVQSSVDERAEELGRAIEEAEGR